MKIRKAKPSDALELINLIQIADNRISEVASKKVRKFIDSDEGFFLIAIEDKKIIGYLLFMIKEEDEKASELLDINHYSCICWIAVNPDFRGKNIGSKLIRESEKYARKYQKGIWLDCRENVVPFYEKNGFRSVGTYQKATSSGILKPCYVMTKKLERQKGKKQELERESPARVIAHKSIPHS